MPHINKLMPTIINLANVWAWAHFVLKENIVDSIFHAQKPLKNKTHQPTKNKKQKKNIYNNNRVLFYGIEGERYGNIVHATIFQIEVLIIYCNTIFRSCFFFFSSLLCVYFLLNLAKQIMDGSVNKCKWFCAMIIFYFFEKV